MNGLLLTLPVALPFTAGLLSYFIRFPSKRAQNLWYGGIICLTTALAWLAILLVGEERVTLLHFTDTLTIARPSQPRSGRSRRSMPATTCAMKSTSPCSGRSSRPPSA